MISLQDRQWKAFNIYEIFETQRFKDRLQLPTGANIKKENLDAGDEARITVTSFNNGIYGFYSSKSKNYRLFKNIVSLSFLGNCFYHPYKCSLDMKVHCLNLKDRQWNKYIASFIINQLHSNTRHANYGNQLSSTDAPYKKVLLPVNDDSMPDYEFMELYMKQMEDRIFLNYRRYIDKQLNILGCKQNIKSLSKCDWKQFTINELGFSIINSKAYHRENLNCKNGSLPYITRTHNCNGLTDIVTNDSYVVNPKNTISFGAENADFFYQPYEYITGNKMYYIYTNLNKYQLFFIQRCLTKAMSEQFSFGYGMIPERIINRGFMLPVNTSGDPDYEYMEQYIKNAMIDKYNKLLDFIVD